MQENNVGMAQKKTVIIAAVVAVIVILGVSWYFFGRPTPPRATFAPQGALVSGFPQNLVLDQAAAISNSYAIAYSPNLNQYTANWTSTSSMDTLYQHYLQYFTENGWAITNSSTNITAFRGIYAVTSSAEANVTLDDSGVGGLKVTVSYIKN